MTRNLMLVAIAVAGLSAGSACSAEQGHGWRDGGLKSMDANGDGQVTRQEATDAAKARFAKMDTNHDGKLTADDFSGKSDRFDPARFLSRADENGDGAVTENEWVDRSLARFDRRDANKDGVLTADEMKAPDDRSE